MMSIFRGDSWKGPITRPSLLSLPPPSWFSAGGLWWPADGTAWWNSLSEPMVHPKNRLVFPGPLLCRQEEKGDKMVYCDHLQQLQGRAEPFFPKCAPIMIIILITAHENRGFVFKMPLLCFCIYQDGVVALCILVEVSGEQNERTE